MNFLFSDLNNSLYSSKDRTVPGLLPVTSKLDFPVVNKLVTLINTCMHELCINFSSGNTFINYSVNIIIGMIFTT
jgi:hypothetical protein